MISAETKFLLHENKWDARAFIYKNTIELGEAEITLETLIHEINEIENMTLLKKFGLSGNTRVKVNKEWRYLSHIISPYGAKTLIEPCKAKYHQYPRDETPLL